MIAPLHLPPHLAAALALLLSSGAAAAQPASAPAQLSPTSAPAQLSPTSAPAPPRPASAPPIKPAAAASWRRAMALYQQGRLDEAAREYRAGLAIDPQPRFHFALGQVERRRGRVERAREHLRSFLKDVPRGKTAAAARALLRALERPAAAPPQSLPALTGGTAASEPPERHWYDDWIGGALSGVGVAALITGSTLYLSGRNNADEAAENYPEYLVAQADGRAARWELERRAGVGLLVAGGALILTGVVRYLFFIFD